MSLETKLRAMMRGVVAAFLVAITPIVVATVGCGGENRPTDPADPGGEGEGEGEGSEGEGEGEGEGLNPTCTPGDVRECAVGDMNVPGTETCSPDGSWSGDCVADSCPPRGATPQVGDKCPNFGFDEVADCNFEANPATGTSECVCSCGESARGNYDFLSQVCGLADS